MRPLIGLIGGVALVCCMAAPALATDVPYAADDYVETANKIVHLDVLANDTASGTPVLRIATAPSIGEAVVIATGSPKIKYTFFAPHDGVDTFRYELCDQSGSCSTATVTVGFLSPGPTSTTTDPNPASPPTTEIPSAPSETTGEPSTPPAPEQFAGKGGADVPNPTATILVAEASSPVVLAPTTGAAPKVHLLGETTLRSYDLLTAGTAIGEPRGIRLAEDVAYLGRSGVDTLALIATPALMVSGIVGFLMIGLPQNAVGSALGFLTVCRRKKKDKTESRSSVVTPD